MVSGQKGIRRFGSKQTPVLRDFAWELGRRRPTAVDVGTRELDISGVTHVY